MDVRFWFVFVFVLFFYFVLFFNGVQLLYYKRNNARLKKKLHFLKAYYLDASLLSWYVLIICCNFSIVTKQLDKFYLIYSYHCWIHLHSPDSLIDKWYHICSFNSSFHTFVFIQFLGRNPLLCNPLQTVLLGFSMLKAGKY